MATPRQGSDGRPDGYMVGQDAADKVGFYGVTPVVQPTSASQAAVVAKATTAMSTTLTLSAANSSTVFGFASSTVGKEIVKSVSEQQVDLAAVIVLANQIRSELVAQGLILGS